MKKEEILEELKEIEQKISDLGFTLMDTKYDSISKELHSIYEQVDKIKKDLEVGKIV
ncbi:MAG: hypothetical protein ACTSV7_15105 [Candidatus Baldrarchaeia archaeon]